MFSTSGLESTNALYISGLSSCAGGKPTLECLSRPPSELAWTWGGHRSFSDSVSYPSRACSLPGGGGVGGGVASGHAGVLAQVRGEPGRRRARSTQSSLIWVCLMQAPEFTDCVTSVELCNVA